MPIKIGYASGVFDLFHIGHLNLLRNARERCDYLIAGVSTPDMAFEVKGTRPVVPLDERIEIVRSCRYVDQAVADKYIDKTGAWHEHGFDVYFKGSDWIGTQKGADLQQGMAEIGVEVVFLPYTPTTSSTELRRALSRLTIVAGDAAVVAGDAAVNA